MANVNGIPGFTQLSKLNVTETLLLQGAPISGAGIPDAPVDGTTYGRENANWVAVTEEAPNDGQQYARQSEAWAVVPDAGIGEAPNDGQQYARQTQAWAVVAGGGSFSITEVLNGASTTDQIPASVDVPIQVEFGAAQGTGSDPVELSAAGAITFNQAGAYFVTAFFAYSRDLNVGESIGFFRALVNATPTGIIVAIQMTDGNDTSPLQFQFWYNATAADVLTFEFVRDSGASSAADGELRAFTNAIGWGTSPSASIRVDRA